MIKNRFDSIVTTGCSHSCGMEMNDHLLPTVGTTKEREINIIKWFKSNLKFNHKDFHLLKDHAIRVWENEERKKSWPTLLGNILDIPVTNLARIGASSGRSLLDYSAYLRSSWEGKRTAVIHQIPAYGRMYIRFNREHGRINIAPGRISNIGFDKKYFSKEIKALEQKYKYAMTKDCYLVNYHNKVLSRLSKLSIDRKITEFYIFDEPNSDLTNGVILDDFQTFRSRYTKGTFGHTNDPKFNADFCKLIIPYLT